MARYIFEYAEEHKINLTLNDKNVSGLYPFLGAVTSNKIEIVQLLINYANKRNVILEINDKDNKGLYPLLIAISMRNDPEMVKIILEYASKNNIIVKLKENELMNSILSVLKVGIKSISDIKPEIIKLLYKYNKDGIIDITFEDNSELAKKFAENNELSEINEKSAKISPYSSPITKVEEKGDLALVLYDFNGLKSGELTIHKNEYLIVTDWHFKEGWAYGYRKTDPQNKGSFPYSLVRKCSNEG